MLLRHGTPTPKEHRAIVAVQRRSARFATNCYGRYNTSVTINQGGTALRLAVRIYDDKWLRMSISTKVNIFLYGDAKLNLHSNMELFESNSQLHQPYQ